MIVKLGPDISQHYQNTCRNFLKKNPFLHEIIIIITNISFFYSKLNEYQNMIKLNYFNIFFFLLQKLSEIFMTLINFFGKLKMTSELWNVLKNKT